MTDSLKQLKEITAALLSPASDYNTLRQSAYALKDLFTQAAGFDEGDFANQQHIPTAAGLAVGPYAAAFCIIDMMRTVKFLRGIKEAVDERLKMNPGKPVLVFYAGSGPFATLLTPLITCFSPGQLQMVLLEINETSIGYLQKTIQHFNMAEYVKAVEQGDAVQYNIPEQYQPDILVSETMKPGLAKEPQVAVAASLLPQCNRQPILIPQKIKISLCLSGNLMNDPEAFIELQVLFELNTTTALQIKNDPVNIPVLSGGVDVIIPERPEPHFTKLVLDTRITVFGNHVLGLQESGLTITVPVMDIAAIKEYPARLRFRYAMGSNPGFGVEEFSG